MAAVPHELEAVVIHAPGQPAPAPAAAPQNAAAAAANLRQATSTYACTPKLKAFCDHLLSKLDAFANGVDPTITSFAPQQDGIAYFQETLGYNISNKWEYLTASISLATLIVNYLSDKQHNPNSKLTVFFETNILPFISAIDQGTFNLELMNSLITCYFWITQGATAALAQDFPDRVANECIGATLGISALVGLGTFFNEKNEKLEELKKSQEKQKQGSEQTRPADGITVIINISEKAAGKQLDQPLLAGQPQSGDHEAHASSHGSKIKHTLSGVFSGIEFANTSHYLLNCIMELIKKGAGRNLYGIAGRLAATLIAGVYAARTKLNADTNPENVKTFEKISTIFTDASLCLMAYNSGTLSITLTLAGINQIYKNGPAILAYLRSCYGQQNEAAIQQIGGIARPAAAAARAEDGQQGSSSGWSARLWNFCCSGRGDPVAALPYCAV